MQGKQKGGDLTAMGSSNGYGIVKMLNKQLTMVTIITMVTNITKADEHSLL